MENETTNPETTEKNEESTVDSSAVIKPIHTSVTTEKEVVSVTTEKEVVSVTTEKEVVSVTNKGTNSSTTKKSKHRKRNLGYI